MECPSDDRAIKGHHHPVASGQACLKSGVIWGEVTSGGQIRRPARSCATKRPPASNVSDTDIGNGPRSPPRGRFPSRRAVSLDDIIAPGRSDRSRARSGRARHNCAGLWRRHWRADFRATAVAPEPQVAAAATAGQHAVAAECKRIRRRVEPAQLSARRRIVHGPDRGPPAPARGGEGSTIGREGQIDRLVVRSSARPPSYVPTGPTARSGRRRRSRAGFLAG